MPDICLTHLVYLLTGPDMTSLAPSALKRVCESFPAISPRGVPRGDGRLWSTDDRK